MALVAPQARATPKQTNGKKEIKNEAAKHAARMMTSQVAQSNGLLWNDYQLLVRIANTIFIGFPLMRAPGRQRAMRCTCRTSSAPRMITRS